MVSKEGMSFLPGSSPKQSDLKDTGQKIRKAHLWPLVATLALILCWNALLTVRSLRNPGRLNDFPQFENIIKQEEPIEEREGRQLQAGVIEGDIVIRNHDLADPTSLNAHLADPDRLWPNGLIGFKFHKNFPASSRRTVKRTMAYLTGKFPGCITFEEATSSTVDYVLFRDELNCRSELGRTGGEQVVALNRGCLKDGLMTATHEMLHMLGFVHEHMRPDRDNFIAIHNENIEQGMEKNFEKRNWGQADFFKKGDVDHMNSPYDVSSLLHYGPQDFSKNGENVLSYIHGLPDLSWPEPAPEDPLSVIDEVELAMAYGCQLPQERILQYIHFNRHHNTMMINKLREEMTARLRHIARQSECEAPWTKLSTGCYMFVESAMTQSEARNFCENELEIPAHLVEIDSEEEKDAIFTEYIRQGFKDKKIDVWLGISDRHSEGVWVFESNGKSVTYANWDDDEPNDVNGAENCAHMESNGKWNDRDCSAKTSAPRWALCALCEVSKK